MTSLQTRTPAVNLPEQDRAAFVIRVYQHVLAAVVAFVAIEALFFMTGVAESIYDMTWGSGGGGRWLLMLGVFMVGQWFVNQAVSDLDNPARQYAGLFGSAAIYAVIFAPFLWYVYNVKNSSSTVASAAIVTAIGFALLSFVAFTTRKDLSFMRPLVMWGFGGAMLMIVASVLFGWNLGTWFSVAMVGLSGAAILYQTQNIIRNFPANAHVAAAVQLFGSVMTMFWYILRIFASRD
ncbi:MAG: Bax inhibitor-1/YccA family protein [Acidimicrobiales bacterium]|jgi:FtsH-binding integral membrane protein|tara:strand:+ start:117 stop:824 length:708 start_codon:yes stop_codon:yes gene_type:complete